MMRNRRKLMLMVAITLGILIVPAAVGMASARAGERTCGNHGSGCDVAPQGGTSQNMRSTAGNTGRSADGRSAKPSTNSAGSWINNQNESFRVPSSGEPMQAPSEGVYLGSDGGEPAGESGIEVIIISNAKNGAGGAPTASGDVLILSETSNGAP